MRLIVNYILLGISWWWIECHNLRRASLVAFHAFVCVVPQIAMAERYGVRLDDYPRLRRVYRACLSLAAFQAAAPDTQPDNRSTPRT